jgi:hypothetical protein
MACGRNEAVVKNAAKPPMISSSMGFRPDLNPGSGVIPVSLR